MSIARVGGIWLPADNKKLIKWTLKPARFDPLRQKARHPNVEHSVRIQPFLEHAKPCRRLLTEEPHRIHSPRWVKTSEPALDHLPAAIYLLFHIHSPDCCLRKSVLVCPRLLTRSPVKSKYDVVEPVGEYTADRVYETPFRAFAVDMMDDNFGPRLRQGVSR